jgi:Ca-activated chloride channel family protein
MQKIKYLLLLVIILPATASAWQWADLWKTPDQQGIKLLENGKADTAVHVFKDKNWQAVSFYRSGDYEKAFKQFNENKTSDGQYNAGNAAAFEGKYQDAIAAYDKAIALNSNNNDAIMNREIVKKLLVQKQQQPQQNQQQKQNQQNQSASNRDKSNSQQNNSGQQNQADKQKQETKKNSPANSNQANNSKPNQQENAQQKSGDQNQQQNANPASASSKQQRQDENNNQLLRRLPDDPGGLLQQKFLRDYARRHAGEENSAQGVTQ